MIIEYDGTAYAGWQRQENALAVQQVVEDALRRLSGDKTVLHFSSRTDSGVHALCQNVHFDTAMRIPPEKISHALNPLLPSDIRIRRSMAATQAFHARYSATSKIYSYSIFNAPHASAIGRHTCTHVPLRLSLSAMQEEAAAMVGRHDFAAFASAGSVVRETVRTIYQTQVTKKDEHIEIRIHGDGFLYNMVRIFAGTLISVGSGKLERGAVARAITSHSREDLGLTAAARGLTLLRVFYGDDARASDYFI